MWPNITTNYPLSFGSDGSAPGMDFSTLSLGSDPSGQVAKGAVGMVANQPANTAVLGAAPGVAGLSGAMNGAGAQGGFLKGIGGLDGLASIAKGIGSLGSMFAAFKGLSLAKDQFNFQKQSYATNLANQTKSYNTELTDRATARFQGTGSATAATDAADYIAKNKL